MEYTRVLNFINPATNESFGRTYMATPADIAGAFRELRHTFRIWGAKPVTERVRILRLFQQLLLDSLDEITDVLTQDCGKSRQDALIEVFITIDMLAQYCRHAPDWLQRQSVSRGLYLFKKCYVEYRPYGVVAVIAPWNYPLALALPPMLAALLAGNTVVLKPSEVTAASGVLIEKLFQRVPELAPFVRVLHGDGEVGAAMVKAGPDYIFVTGSTPTGRKVMHAAAEHLIPVACELGGKDAMLVLEDANIAEAARWGVWGAFFNAGQTCMAVERVYAVEAVYDAFVEQAVAEAQRLKMGYTRDQESEFYLGPITDRRQVEIIRDHLEDAVKRGARILTGGTIDHMFVEPTVLVDVDHSMLIMQEETFGPIMPIMKVRDEREAIRCANDSAFGLGASIWSNDLKRAQRVAHQVEASAVIVNDTIGQFAVPMLPFGGSKQSGNGRIHGREGLMQFTQPYSYVVGGPPPAWDIGTILRQPGHYHDSAALMRVLFSTTPQRRLQAAADAIAQRVARTKRQRSVGLGSSLGIGAALAGMYFIRRHTRGRSR